MPTSAMWYRLSCRPLCSLRVLGGYEHLPNSASGCKRTCASIASEAEARICTYRPLGMKRNDTRIRCIRPGIDQFIMQVFDTIDIFFAVEDVLGIIGEPAVL